MQFTIQQILIYCSSFLLRFEQLKIGYSLSIACVECLTICCDILLQKSKAAWMTFLTQRELPHSREDCPVCVRRCDEKLKVARTIVTTQLGSALRDNLFQLYPPLRVKHSWMEELVFDAENALYSSQHDMATIFTTRIE